MTTKSVYLQPGEILICQAETVLTTILGSCVAVCIYDHERKTGGMNHFMFPLIDGGSTKSGNNGEYAVSELIRQIHNSGSINNNLEAKLFGGAKLHETSSEIFNAGTKNCSLARMLVEEFRIPIISADLGGILGRKIQFNTYTGEVLVNYLDTNQENGKQ
ncbi:MAG: chemotaxis protein CheD [Bacteroidota bacterium]|nr:chemotaxis protein CheD [Bacteroidota bacterium]